MEASTKKKLIISAVSMFFIIILASVLLLGYYDKKREREFWNSEKGKKILRLNEEIKKFSYGTVILFKNGEVALVDLIDHTRPKDLYAIYYSVRGRNYPTEYNIITASSFESHDIQAFYIPNQKGLAAKERVYLLEMFAQNKKVPSDWKKYVRIAQDGVCHAMWHNSLTGHKSYGQWTSRDEALYEAECNREQVELFNNSIECQ